MRHRKLRNNQRIGRFRPDEQMPPFKTTLLILYNVIKKRGIRS